LKRSQGSQKTRGQKISNLSTEQVNPRSRGLDTKSALEIARFINAEDAKVGNAVKRALPEISKAIDMIAAALKNGGRLIYVGAGTSGRIAALDAAECAPTFNVDPKTVQFVMAGGAKALSIAVEASEDSRQLGESEIATRRPGKKDVVVGIAASGRTPFTVAGLSYARRKGAKTIAVTCNQDSPLEKAAHLAIVTDVGPEIIAGSSRMKAGTAQKMVLNMLSSGAMTRLGYIYDGLMVNVHLRNEKLVDRGIGIVQQAAKVTRSEAERALQASANKVPVAIVMLKARVSAVQASRALKATHGNVREAIVVSPACSDSLPNRPCPSD
jgi:N-acetylmuramic acid 6-phosphate etherase